MRNQSSRYRSITIVVCFVLLAAVFLGATMTIDQQTSGTQLVSVGAAISSRHVQTVGLGDSTRTLAEFYARRAYPGAPPIIPHTVADDRSFGGRTCLRCHARDRYNRRIGAYTPKTPHPELISCRSCHVPLVASDEFRATAWIVPDPPARPGGVLPGSPPAMPHTLQLRDNCQACHTGPGSVSELRTSHPDRTNCLQCHVEPAETGVWVR